ncbi:TlpA family protein disulfide reductase [Tamlana fucoidanivorans]|uniref:TlpA family protein disulfide reductase n=1 Tax=Allotamlana fucoidanivorans TaxID=2583814 RepID=A0A5C4SC52_9FLAO|nr:TlpA disulfide reductase family protein [Tamlana fucoidanivorans]TNJ40917.1 TlpA family protein disulfide reductase [Tamlana fucoidanivorans]
MKKIILLITLLSISNFYAQEKKLWAKSFINKKAPEIVVEKWLTEKPETNGKFVLIDFWATWCGPCKKAIPELNEFHHKFKDKLVVIGISDEPKGKVKKMKNPKMEYYSAIDTKERLERIYEVKGIPHCVIIDPNGIVVWEGWPQQKGFELTEKIISGLIKNY